MSTPNQETRYRGRPVCSGIAIGTAYRLVRQESKVLEFSLKGSEVDSELAYFRAALQASRREVTQLSSSLQDEGAVEGAAILDTHLQLLKEPALTTQIEDRIRSLQKNSAFLLQQAVSDYEQRFSKLEDPYFKERVRDLQDVARRVLSRLKQDSHSSLAEVPPGSIVFANELIPSEAAEAHSACIKAFVTFSGGDTSHAAILAKARGIPYVGNVHLEEALSVQQATVIVDGRTGEVIINPTVATLSKYEELQREHERHAERFERLGKVGAETIDGYTISVSANVEMYNEIEPVHRYGGDGIGLFRSEYLCLSNNTLPSESEQFAIYKRIAEEMQGKPVVIRTFDIGGDKFTEMRQEDEGNPFLGCRAIRLMLKEHEAFKTQLRAILRASAHGALRILFPMVSGLAELREAKGYVDEVKEELRRANEPFDEKIPVGCMIEVPSAAITCDLLAKECDFLSIGTNDLVQYSLAVDRSNQAMEYLYTPAHPSVIRLIKMVVNEANRNGIPVTLCGEVAADPRFVPLLLGLGLNGLSVTSRCLPVVKNAIRQVSIVNATRLAERVLRLQTPIEVLDLLIQEHKQTLETPSEVTDAVY